MTDRTVRRAVGAAALAAAAGMLGACTSAQTMSQTATRTTTASGGEVMLAAGESMATMFADPKIAAVGSASNQFEIQTSQLALTMASDARVRQFAQMMVSQHTTVENQMKAMLSAKGLAPVDNALSIDLKNVLQATLAELRGQSGASFDQAYMMHQVHAHDMTLKTLDTTLIPETDDAAMKAFLQNTVRPAVAEHLRQAKEIEHGLMMGMR